MRRPIAILRLSCAAFLTLLSFAVWALTIPFVFWWTRGRIAIRNAIFRFWSRALVFLFRVSVEVEGTPPEPPFFLVSNHLGYLDIVVLSSRVDAAYVAKAEIERWPFMGRISRTFDTIFIDRESRRDIPRVLAHMERLLENGLNIIVFPEGTSTKGAHVRRFLPSLLEIPAGLELPVSWATLTYSTPPGEVPAHESVCWWGNAPFLPHAMRMASLPRIRARVVFGQEKMCSADRKELAKRLHWTVQEHFVPVVEDGTG